MPVLLNPTWGSYTTNPSTGVQTQGVQYSGTSFAGVPPEAHEVNSTSFDSVKSPSNSLNLNLGNNVKLSLNYETSDKEIDHSETAKNSLG